MNLVYQIYLLDVCLGPTEERLGYSIKTNAAQ